MNSPCAAFKGVCNKDIFSANIWSSKNILVLLSCPKVVASKRNTEKMCNLKQHKEKINHLKTKKETKYYYVKTLHSQI